MLGIWKSGRCGQKTFMGSLGTSIRHHLAQINLVVWLYMRHRGCGDSRCWCNCCAGGKSSSCNDQCRHHGDWVSARQMVSCSHHDPRASHWSPAYRSVWWAVINCWSLNSWNLLDIISSETFTEVKDINLIRITNALKIFFWCYEYNKHTKI